jgi:hypothetical protein
MRSGSRGGGPGARLLGVATALVFFALYFRLGFHAPAPGLDSSWIWGINEAAATGALPGRDVVFTYGPLGFLLLPTPTGHHFVWATLAALLVTGLATLLLLRHLRRRGALRALLFLAGWLAAVCLRLPQHTQWLLLFPFLLAPGADLPRGPRIALPLATLLGCALLLVRVDLGVCALAAAAVVLALRARRGELAASGAVAAAAALIATVTVFDGPSNAVAWLREQGELVVGYSATMGDEGPTVVLVASLLAVLTYFAALTSAWLRRERHRVLVLAFLPAVIVQWKHSVVRHSAGHAGTIFPLLVALLVALALLAPRRREAWIAFAASAVVALLALAARPSTELVGVGTVLAESRLHLGGAVRLARTRTRFRRMSKASLAALAFPSPPAFGPDATFDALPFDLTLLPANHLRWRPNPVLQLYAAYTRHLDERCAAHFAGPSAPSHVLVDRGRIDLRQPVWDAPRTWQALIAAYQPAVALSTPAAGPVLVLARRASPLAWSTERLAPTRIRWGEWLAVPRDPDGFTFAELELRPSLRGRLASAALRAPPVWLDVREVGEGAGSYRSPLRRWRWRLVAATASGGLLVDPLPSGLERLRLAWSGQRGPAVEIRLTGSPWAVAPPRLTWRLARLGPPVSALSPSPASPASGPAPR